MSQSQRDRCCQTTSPERGLGAAGSCGEGRRAPWVLVPVLQDEECRAGYTAGCRAMWMRSEPLNSWQKYCNEESCWLYCSTAREESYPYKPSVQSSSSVKMQATGEGMARPWTRGLRCPHCPSRCLAWVLALSACQSPSDAHWEAAGDLLPHGRCAVKVSAHCQLLGASNQGMCFMSVFLILLFKINNTSFKNLIQLLWLSCHFDCPRNHYQGTVEFSFQFRDSGTVTLITWTAN